MSSATSPMQSVANDQQKQALPPRMADRQTSRLRIRTNSLASSTYRPRDSLSTLNRSIGPSPLSQSFRPPATPPRQHSNLRFLDLNFQSFAVPLLAGSPSRPPSIAGPSNSLPPLLSLSQPLFESKGMNQAPIFPPTFSHPNSPYVPLDSPVRREFFRPLTPESYVSHFSGFSRSGAVAPEPWEHDSYHPSNATLIGMSNRIRKIRRIVRRNVAQVARRIHTFRKPPPSSQSPREPKVSESLPRTPSPTQEHFPRPHIRSMSDASFATTQTNSLAQWLEARRQASMNMQENNHDMTLEEYERIGSWIRHNPGPDGYDCGVEDCHFHPHLSPDETDETYHSDDDTTSEESCLHALGASDTTCHSVISLKENISTGPATSSHSLPGL
ncbi:hypothetical protein PQX77_013309 [Marasmius sp. AFHP31]|nr:hypothetical protein PQX77_013309 [Marasmius sp. AFHP31]